MQLECIYFRDEESFRDWLDKNHDTSPGIWMIFYKKHANIPCITYDTALDEALCYGWIDSIIKSVDNEKYLRKFTPRTNLKNWSDINKNKVFRLIESGRMKEAGLMKIDSYLKTGKVEWTDDIEKTLKKTDIPELILKKLGQDEIDLRNFKKMPKSHQLRYVMWINSAKKTETIEKRVKEAILILKNGKKLGMK